MIYFTTDFDITEKGEQAIEAVRFREHEAVKTTTEFVKQARDINRKEILSKILRAVKDGYEHEMSSRLTNELLRLEYIEPKSRILEQQSVHQLMKELKDKDDDVIDGHDYQYGISPEMVIEGIEKVDVADVRLPDDLRTWMFEVTDLGWDIYHDYEEHTGIREGDIGSTMMDVVSQEGTEHVDPERLKQLHEDGFISFISDDPMVVVGRAIRRMRERGSGSTTVRNLLPVLSVYQKMAAGYWVREKELNNAIKCAQRILGDEVEDHEGEGGYLGMLTEDPDFIPEDDKKVVLDILLQHLHHSVGVFNIEGDITLGPYHAEREKRRVKNVETWSSMMIALNALNEGMDFKTGLPHGM